MASVPQAMSTTWQTTKIPRVSQPRDLAKKLRSDLSGLLFDSIESSSPNIARAICREFSQIDDVTTSPSYAALPRMPRRQNPQKPVIGRPSMGSRKLARRHLMALGIAKRKHPL